jgi:hypothetical protein
MPMKRIIYIACILIFVNALGVLNCPAQEALVRSTFRTISLQDPIDDLALLTDGAVIDLDIPSHRRSKSVVYQGSPVMRFIEQGRTLPDSASAFTATLEVSVAMHLENPLYVFYPKASGYEVFAVEDSVEQLSGGSCMFVNLSDHPLILLLDAVEQERLELAPLESHIHGFAPESLNVSLRIASRTDDGLYKGMNTRIFPVRTHRDIYFIYSLGPSHPGEVRLRLLREHEGAALRAYAAELR